MLGAERAERAIELLKRSGVAGVLACALTPHDAWAFRTAGDLAKFASEEPVRWPDSAMSFEISTQDLPENFETRDVAQYALAGFAAWQEPSCAAVDVRYIGSNTSTAELGDGRNTVQFVASGWKARGYSPEQAAVTELDYARDSGSSSWYITEADLFINAEDFAWTLEPAMDKRPIASLFLHEGGHMLGL